MSPVHKYMTPVLISPQYTTPLRFLSSQHTITTLVSSHPRFCLRPLSHPTHPPQPIIPIPIPKAKAKIKGRAQRRSFKHIQTGIPKTKSTYRHLIHRQSLRISNPRVVPTRLLRVAGARCLTKRIVIIRQTKLWRGGAGSIDCNSIIAPWKSH